MRKILAILIIILGTTHATAAEQFITFRAENNAECLSDKKGEIIFDSSAVFWQRSALTKKVKSSLTPMTGKASSSPSTI